jgi:hypothetical protein
MSGVLVGSALSPLLAESALVTSSRAVLRAAPFLSWPEPSCLFVVYLRSLLDTGEVNFRLSPPLFPILPCIYPSTCFDLSPSSFIYLYLLTKHKYILLYSLPRWSQFNLGRLFFSSPTREPDGQDAPLFSPHIRPHSTCVPPGGGPNNNYCTIARAHSPLTGGRAVAEGLPPGQGGANKAS